MTIIPFLSFLITLFVAVKFGSFTSFLEGGIWISVCRIWGRIWRWLWGGGVDSEAESETECEVVFYILKVCQLRIESSNQQEIGALLESFSFLKVKSSDFLCNLQANSTFSKSLHVGCTFYSGVHFWLIVQHCYPSNRVMRKVRNNNFGIGIDGPFITW